MKPEYINVDQIDAILAALEDLKGSVAAIDKSVGEMKVDLGHVKEQTTKTNGRVDGLEDREIERDKVTAGLAGEARVKAALVKILNPVGLIVLGVLVILALQHAPEILKAAGK